MEENKIKDWLKKGGFIFELECINEFRSEGFYVEPGVHYYDESADLHREVDFMAHKNVTLTDLDYTFNICFVVECKAHIEPIVAVSTLSNFKKENILANVICNKNISNLQVDIAQKGGLNNFTFGLLENEIVPQNLVAYTGGSNKNNDNKKDRVYESMMQSFNACQFLRDTSNKMDTRFSNIYIPVVIFDNSLSIARANDNEIEVSMIDYCKVSKLYAFNKNNPYTFFHIVSSKGLKNYCRTISSETDDFLKQNAQEIRKIGQNNPNNTGKGKYHIG